MALDYPETNKRDRSWWKLRTRMEKNGIILLVLACILIIILIIALAVVAHKSKGSAADICTTPGCVESAAKILSNLDESVDPCTNFYQFACGGFLQKTIIPDDDTEIGTLNVIQSKLNQQLENLLEAPSSSNEPEAFLKLKTLYKSCMDTKTIEEEGLSTIKDLISKVGGWPILEGKNWNQDRFEWQQSVYKFREYGLSVKNFVAVAVEPDLKNSSRVVISLDQAELDILQESLLNGLDDPTVQFYYNHYLELALSFGANKAYAEYDIKNMLEFRRQLANISLSREQRTDRSKVYHLMTLNELQQTYPSIYWLEFINNVIAIPEYHITTNDYVNVNVPKYLSGITDVLRQSSKRTQANHAIFQAVQSLALYLPKSVRDLEQNFKKALYGMKENPTRGKECVKDVSDRFEIAISALYVRNYFSTETKEAATEIVLAVKNAFMEILKKNTWMDDRTKNIAIEKAKTMKSFVGNAYELLDDKKLTEYYSNLSIDSTNALLIVLNVSVFNLDNEMVLLNKQLNRSDWRQRLPSTTVNAVYLSHENSIQIPAVLLQNVIFNKDRLKALNYGGLGYFTGHEITHGFDDEGKEYNVEGNYDHWWAKETHEAFLSKAQCIINQYSNYTVPEVNQNINGLTTQGENIADNGGIKEAYLAYISWIKRNEEESKLPGLKYTPKQLFWISAATCWCTLSTAESLEADLSQDIHSPAEFRIIGPFSNTEYFAADFECPVNSKMNPQHKCQVW